MPRRLECCPVRVKISSSNKLDNINLRAYYLSKKTTNAKSLLDNKLGQPRKCGKGLYYEKHRLL